MLLMKFIVLNKKANLRMDLINLLFFIKLSKNRPLKNIYIRRRKLGDNEL